VTFSERDLDYIRRNYVPLEQAVQDAIEGGVLPRPSYVLPDGTQMVPADYLALVDVRPSFERRYLTAGGRLDELDEDWQAYTSGTYGVCLQQVAPETIVRKGVLVASLTHLLDEPREDDPEWRAALRDQVNELDQLEREFAPDYDRNVERFGRPPTRDLLIKAARERFPDVFASRAA
jgi:hypothetical protein